MFQDELTEVYGLGACPACTPGQLEGGEGGGQNVQQPPKLNPTGQYPGLNIRKYCLDINYYFILRKLNYFVDTLQLVAYICGH